MIRKYSDSISTELLVPFDRAQKLFKKYTDKELQELVDFIKAGNEVPPIVAAEDFQLVDGYNRLEAYMKAGIELIPTDVYAYASETEMEIHAICLNAKRRHLDSVEAARYAARLAELLAPKVEEVKQIKSDAGKKGGRGNKAPTTPSVNALRTDRTLEKAAKQVGVSPQTVRQVKKVDETKDAALISAMENKVIPIKKAAEIATIEDPKERREVLTVETQKALAPLQKIADALKPAPSGAPIISAGCIDCIMKLNHILKVIKFDAMTEEECLKQKDAIISVGLKCKEVLDKIKSRYKQLTGKDVQ